MKVTADAIKQERARRNLLNFIQYTFTGYEAQWFHEYICYALDLFVKREIKKLMIFVPPQHGKSEISSRRFPGYLLGHRPNDKVAVCSYSPDLAKKFNRDVQRIIDSPEYKKIFPRTSLNSKNVATSSRSNYLRNADEFEIVGYKGGLKAVGVNTALTGNPVDVGIIDDPYKDRTEAESPTIRNKVWAWYMDVFNTRLHNDSQQLLLFTRWHEDDIAGRILKEELQKPESEREWIVIKLKGIKDEEGLSIDPREIGEALWESKHSAKRLMEAKQRNSRTFFSLYQQEPRPLEGNLIKRDKIHIITWEEFYERVGTRSVTWNFKVDGAYTSDTQNDESAVSSCCFVDNIFYFRCIEGVRKEFPQFCDYLIKFVNEHGYDALSTIKIEPKANGKSVVQNLVQNTMLNVEEYKFPYAGRTRLDDKDKTTRVFSIINTINAGRVCLIQGDWNEPFLEQATAFPNDAHDDRVDVFTMELIENVYGNSGEGVIYS